MRIIFMGTPDFATGTLDALIEAGHEIALVVTQPDKPGNRGKMQPPAVKQLAEQRGLPVFQPVKVREPEAIRVLREQNADLIVVVAFGQILPQEILDLTPHGCINVHASLLPAYRGAAPIQWALLNGDPETGVTIMQMDAGLDTGNILAQKKLAIAPDETGGSLFDKLAALGASLCVETIDLIERGAVTPVPQGETTTPYAKMLTKKMGEIDWNRPADEIERMIRGLSPWPGAYTYRNGTMLKVKKAEIAGAEGETVSNLEAVTESSHNPGAPGSIASDASGNLLVQTGCGVIAVTKLQPAGKKTMAAADYLRGKPVQEGEELG